MSRCFALCADRGGWPDPSVAVPSKPKDPHKKWLKSLDDMSLALAGDDCYCTPTVSGPNARMTDCRSDVVRSTTRTPSP